MMGEIIHGNSYYFESDVLPCGMAYRFGSALCGVRINRCSALLRVGILYRYHVPPPPKRGGGLSFHTALRLFQEGNT